MMAYRNTMRMVAILACGSIASFVFAGSVAVQDLVTGNNIFPSADISREVGAWTDLKFTVLCLIVFGGALLGLSVALVAAFVKQSNTHTDRMTRQGDRYTVEKDKDRLAFATTLEGIKTSFESQMAAQREMTERVISDINKQWSETVSKFASAVCPIMSRVEMEKEIRKQLNARRPDGRVDP